MITFTLSFIILCIGYYKAVADIIQASQDYREREWKAKYKLDKAGNPIPLYFDNHSFIYFAYTFIFSVKYQEKFLLSTTALVFLTDSWHRMNFAIHLLCFVAVCIVAISNIGLNLIWITPVAYFSGFHLGNFTNQEKE